ncbi:MAG: elongator complex protein 3 [Anaerovoracaceae bacterium]
MKKHAIIPIFIPHKGCPNDCVFCNQKKITARTKPLDKEGVIETIETYLSTLLNRDLETIEIAFYGGSFTGIPLKEQKSYLSIAKSYKDKGLINKIHLSTRPDYIDEKILEHLKSYGVDIIELGVQSFDEEVLRLSNRGHSKEIVYESSRLIKNYDFELGLQLMIGLPGDTHEKSIASAKEVVKIGPSIARLYPTVIIRDTALYEMYARGDYVPLSEEEAIHTTKEMYLILKKAGINVIRIGLKSSDFIDIKSDVGGGSFHPAFRQLVEAEIAKEELESQLIQLLANTNQEQENIRIQFFSNGPSFSNMVGNKKSNRIYFEKKYPHVRITFHVDHTLLNDVYLAKG